MPSLKALVIEVKPPCSSQESVLLKTDFVSVQNVSVIEFPVMPAI
jgi:hypothetical protein